MARLQSPFYSLLLFSQSRIQSCRKHHRSVILHLLYLILILVIIVARLSWSSSIPPDSCRPLLLIPSLSAPVAPSPLMPAASGLRRRRRTSTRRSSSSSRPVLSFLVELSCPRCTVHVRVYVLSLLSPTILRYVGTLDVGLLFTVMRCVHIHFPFSSPSYSSCIPPYHPPYHCSPLHAYVMFCVPCVWKVRVWAWSCDRDCVYVCMSTFPFTTNFIDTILLPHPVCCLAMVHTYMRRPVSCPRPRLSLALLDAVSLSAVFT